MRYLQLFLAYLAVSLVLLLIVLFPERLSSPIDFLILSLYFLPCVGTFDIVAQRVMDNKKFSGLPHVLKLLIGIVSLVAFIYALGMLADVIGMERQPW